MQATANPLRKSRPSRDRWVLHGRFYFTDQNGRLESELGTNLCLTAEELWVTPELSIALESLDSMQIVEKSGVPSRRFLEIVHANPITAARETVRLCKPDSFGIGLYRMGPVEELKRRIEELRPQIGAQASVAAEALAVPDSPPPVVACEACGATPAFYVGYTYLVSALLVSYRSEAKRRLHCRRHNAVHGLAYYLLTVFTGWLGIGVFAYPATVLVAARNLAPSFGRASTALGIVPPILLAALLAQWLL